MWLASFGGTGSLEMFEVVLFGNPSCLFGLVSEIVPLVFSLPGVGFGLELRPWLFGGQSFAVASRVI